MLSCCNDLLNSYIVILLPKLIHKNLNTEFAARRIFTERKTMDGFINSDPTMAANKAFDMILNCVQKSCLNYHVQLSPFSAVISIKKTLMKTLDGTPLFPKILESEAKTEHNELSILKESTQICYADMKEQKKLLIH